MLRVAVGDGGEIAKLWFSRNNDVADLISHLLEVQQRNRAAGRPPLEVVYVDCQCCNSLEGCCSTARRWPLPRVSVCAGCTLLVSSSVFHRHSSITHRV